ncbi:GPI ethanolamine phosphate transferase 1-like [Arctopsyche grandis]|uniref:GPI ethanolamine phosphate transferase 1-like n=1 Tax=Arctopsyche grandis TaxID=121162 RepID=UPI00406D9DAE
MLAAAFDIYFRSPVVGGGSGSGSNSVSVSASASASGFVEVLAEPSAPARRLVLFLADGLRAETLIQSNEMPHLKSIINNRGTWGISHTRIPTESRPGHVAIIAGFYEDPSAITRGWKENPVEFDSVFNQSRYTWSWGSPDILPMFAKGASGDHVYTHSYSHEEEDFSGKVSTSKLDLWVFEHVDKFLSDARHNTKLMSQLKEDKIIFFLHLLGLDTAGHTHKPHSKLYKDNIKTVNSGIAEMENVIEEFFEHDNKTAYVFTSDHGMTDWGSHGAGSNHETETPIIAWGAGIPPPIFSTIDPQPVQNDLSQADICPLIATLIGIDIPVDSVGILPDEYINVPFKDKVSFYHKNMRQMLTQFHLKKQLVENGAIALIYKPFESLTNDDILERSRRIEQKFDSGRFEDAIIEIKNVIQLCLAGSEYYQNYYQDILLKCMTANFLGWIFWLLTVLLQGMQINEKRRHIDKSRYYRTSFNINAMINSVFGAILVLTIFLIYVQQLPIQYYVYFSLPIFHWWKVALSWKSWYEYFSKLNENFQSSSTFISLLTLLSMIGVYLIGIVILILSFFYRGYLSIGLTALAIFPMHSSYRNKIPILLHIVWVITCILLAGFSFLPVIGKQDDKHLVGASALTWLISSFIFLYLHSLPMMRSGKESKRENGVMIIPLVMMITAIQNKYFVGYYFMAKGGLPLVSQCISWMLTIACFIVPMFSSRLLISRLHSINMSLAVFFILLSVSHEGFFLLILSANLLCWLTIEHFIQNTQKDIKLSQFKFGNAIQATNVNKLTPIDRKLDADDFRRSFIFLLYIILAFFGTGNIASVNSFDPNWVRCFVAQFSPFTMTALILCKTLIPFLCVTCTFYAVNLVVKAPTGNLFLIVLIYSDLMGLQFLHMITNKGSWLDIGTSISHYVIMETTVFFLSILYGFGQLLTGTSLWKFIDRNKAKCPKSA